MAATVNVSNIFLDNDLSGTLDNPIVVSVANVRFGTLSVENGGLGGYSLPQGKLLLGNGILPPTFLSGTDGDILSWAEDSGSWVSKRFDNIKSLNISLQNNDVFSLIDTSSGSVKSYNFIFPELNSKLFLASPDNINGTASFRSITSDDLPNNIVNKQFSGNILGTFTGSADVESITGDGSGLYNLSSSQVIDFTNKVQDILNNEDLTFNNLNVSSASIQNANISSGDFFGRVSGTLEGDGSGIENLSTSNIAGLYQYINTFFSGGTGVIIESGSISIDCNVLNITSSDPNILINNVNTTKILSLNSNLTASNISSNLLAANNITSNNIEANVISGNIYGNFNGIYNGPGANIFSASVPNAALQFNFIDINNNRVKLGEAIQVSGISKISSSNDNIITELSGDTSLINLNYVVDLQYLKSNIVSSSQFIGDGSGLTNINLSSLGPISNLIPVDEENIIFKDGILSLSGNLNVQNITSPRANIAELDVYSITGNGSALTNLNANNLINTSSFINSIISAIPTSPIRQFISNLSFNIGDVVAMSGSGLAKADNRSKILSNAVGIVTEISGNTIFVQTSGNAQITNSLSNQISGTILYLGQNADAINYSSISSNCYATQLGTLTSEDKIEINFKKLWKIS